MRATRIVVLAFALTVLLPGFSRAEDPKPQAPPGPQNDSEIERSTKLATDLTRTKLELQDKLARALLELKAAREKNDPAAEAVAEGKVKDLGAELQRVEAARSTLENRRDGGTDAASYESIRLRYLTTGSFGGRLADTGWFDVGAGFGCAIDAGIDDNFASGIVLSLRAYPFCKWYLDVPRDGSVGSPTVTITDRWYWQLPRRLSLFAGISVGEFTGRSKDEVELKAPIPVFGVAYDVAPEFAFLCGVAVIRADVRKIDPVTQARSKELETSFAVYFGVSLNLSSFQSLLTQKLPALGGQ